MATGFSKQSDEPVIACWVELPSNPHIGTSSNLPLKFSIIFVLPRKLAVGLYPSNHKYSTLDLLIYSIFTEQK